MLVAPQPTPWFSSEFRKHSAPHNNHEVRLRQILVNFSPNLPNLHARQNEINAHSNGAEIIKQRDLFGLISLSIRANPTCHSSFQNMKFLVKCANEVRVSI